MFDEVIVEFRKMWAETEYSHDGEFFSMPTRNVLPKPMDSAPLLPVAIEDTFAVHRRGAFLIRPGRVVVAFGTPIDVSGKSTRDRAAATATLRAAIEGLRDEASGADIRSDRRRHECRDRADRRRFWRS